MSGKKDFGAIWRNLAAKMKKLSAKENFAWERRSQAPGFFSKAEQMYPNFTIFLLKVDFTEDLQNIKRNRTKKNKLLIRVSE